MSGRAPGRGAGRRWACIPLTLLLGCGPLPPPDRAIVDRCEGEVAVVELSRGGLPGEDPRGEGPPLIQMIDVPVPRLGGPCIEGVEVSLPDGGWDDGALSPPEPVLAPPRE